MPLANYFTVIGAASLDGQTALAVRLPAGELLPHQDKLPWNQSYIAFDRAAGTVRPLSTLTMLYGRDKQYLPFCRQL